MSFKIAILASGNGTNAQAMLDKIAEGLLHVEIVKLISNRPKAKVLERGQKAGLDTEALDHTCFASRAAYEEALLKSVVNSGAQAVVLAGYMLLLSQTFLTGFAGPVLNLHPALLPSFPGLHGARDALQAGVRLSGCTVHFVDELMDNGPIIIQAAVPVLNQDDEESLLNRIHAMEHRIYPQAVEWLAQGRLSLEGRRVKLTPKAVPCVKPDGPWLVSPDLEEGF